MTTTPEQEAIRVLRVALEEVAMRTGGAACSIANDALHATASIQPVAAPEPVAWMRDNLKECTTAESKRWMEHAGFGVWAEVAATYTIPLYTAAPAQAATDAVRELYTCIGKGGTYSLIGKPCAAGSLRGVLISNDFAVYRDIESGMLFVRLADDFDARMERITTAQAATGEAKPLTRCAAARDGDCTHAQCPQLRDKEPSASGRHCPLDTQDDKD